MQSVAAQMLSLRQLAQRSAEIVVRIKEDDSCSTVGRVQERQALVDSLNAAGIQLYRLLYSIERSLDVLQLAGRTGDNCSTGIQEDALSFWGFRRSDTDKCPTGSKVSREQRTYLFLNEISARFGNGKFSFRTTDESQNKKRKKSTREAMTPTIAPQKRSTAMQ